MDRAKYNGQVGRTKTAIEGNRLVGQLMWKIWHQTNGSANGRQQGNEQEGMQQKGGKRIDKQEGSGQVMMQYVGSKGKGRKIMERQEDNVY